MTTMNTTVNKLTNFLNKHSDLPKQGSSEWLAQRKNTVGGSQIASIMGINKYENLKQFILSKTNKYTFKKAPPLWFGSLMEPCVEQYVAHVYNTKTYETGSLPCEFNDKLSYSPDGLGIVPKNKLQELSSQGILHDLDCEGLPDHPIVLFEFKSPYMRVISSGDIPEYYLPQPLLGMEIIDISDISVFIECVFRFSSISDLRNNRYSRYHFDRQRLDDFIAFSGISLFWKGKPEDLGLLTTDLASVTDKHLINKLMELAIDSGKIDIEYKPLFMRTKTDLDLFNEYLYKSYVKQDSLKENYIGTFTYKLFDVNNVAIKKNKILSEELLMKIDIAFERIRVVTEKISNMSDTEFKKFWKSYDC